MNDATQPNTDVKDTRGRPLRDLRISVTDRCNFRCTYCMPAEIFGDKYKFLTKHKLLTFEEITRVVKLVVRMGGVKLRLTGGEPLVRHELETLVKMLSQVQGTHDLAMTTNGVLLPPKAQALKDAGLQRVTISLDSLDNAVFRAMNGGRADVDDVLKGIEAAERAGLTPIKINAVVKRGTNEHTLVDMARVARDRGWILRFIEYMDVGTRNDWDMSHVVPAEEIAASIDAALPIEPVKANYFGETARRFRYRDGGGEIGIIASVTKPFCGSCTRLRMSPEGQLFTCLFAVDGIDLRAPIRSGASDEDLLAILTGTWTQRDDRYSEVRTSLTEEQRRRPRIEMYYIGG